MSGIIVEIHNIRERVLAEMHRVTGEFFKGISGGSLEEMFDKVSEKYSGETLRNWRTTFKNSIHAHMFYGRH